MTARNFGLSKRPVDSIPTCVNTSQPSEHTLPTTLLAADARKRVGGSFIPESATVPTAADGRRITPQTPSLLGAAATSITNLLTPDVVASSQQDRVVSCAGKDHAFIPANIAHMRSLPYSAVNSRRFILNEDQFFRDITGAS